MSKKKLIITDKIHEIVIDTDHVYRSRKLVYRDMKEDMMRAFKRNKIQITRNGSPSTEWIMALSLLSSLTSCDFILS